MCQILNLNQIFGFITWPYQSNPISSTEVLPHSVSFDMKSFLQLKIRHLSELKFQNKIQQSTDNLKVVTIFFLFNDVQCNKKPNFT